MGVAGLRVAFWGAAGVLMTLGGSAGFKAMNLEPAVLLAALAALATVGGLWTGIGALSRAVRSGRPGTWPLVLLLAAMLAALAVWSAYALVAAGALLGLPSPVCSVLVVGLLAGGAALSCSGPRRDGGGVGQREGGR